MRPVCRCESSARPARTCVRSPETSDGGWIPEHTWADYGASSSVRSRSTTRFLLRRHKHLGQKDWRVAYLRGARAGGVGGGGGGGGSPPPLPRGEGKGGKRDPIAKRPRAPRAV